ncbi:unnamed protein product [Urochloa decumbens]|uniref:F-box domain-containing protein n=1 Tax=Urochloa decumbens TaxID=240449 RepID=A0ABC9GQT5_9POAL
MASPEPSSSPPSQSMVHGAPAASNSGVLPADVLFDVLLRLPAKELCRLRAVCRAWCSLTFDPLFASAHAARHPLFLASFRDDRAHICVVDLCGTVVKRIPNAEGHQLLHTRLDLACVATARYGCRVLNPATGSVEILPERPADDHLNRENFRKLNTSFAFGRIATTGEYKVLRIFDRLSLHGFNEQQLFEVLTIQGASSSSSSGRAQWRARQSHDRFVEASSAIVVGEVVYFKVDRLYDAWIIAGISTSIKPDNIISFDLEREEWKGVLRGPIADIFFTDEYDDHLEDYRILWPELTLADLRGSLSLVHYRKSRRIIDLWVLKDFDTGLWVKEYVIQIELNFPTTERRVKSLFMLEDGRIVIHFPKTGLVFIYDPRTNTSAQMGRRHLEAVAMYTGNLLSLQVGDML